MGENIPVDALSFRKAKQTIRSGSAYFFGLPRKSSAAR